jgi:hypothetical protein
MHLIDIHEVNSNCSDDRFRATDYEKYVCYATTPTIVLECNRFLTQRKILLINIGSWSITKENFLEMPESHRNTTFALINHFYLTSNDTPNSVSPGVENEFVTSLLPSVVDKDALKDLINNLLCQLMNNKFLSSNETHKFFHTYIETLNIEYYECLSDEKFLEYYDKTIPLLEKEITDLEGQVHELSWLLSDKKQKMKHIPIDAMKTRYADLTRVNDTSNGKSDYRFCNEREALMKQKLAIERRLSELN